MPPRHGTSSPLPQFGPQLSTLTEPEATALAVDASASYYESVVFRKLSDSEKAVNVQNGLTPHGLIKLTPEDRRKAKLVAKKARRDQLNQITSKQKVPVGRAQKISYPEGDYRCQGRKFTVGRKNHYLRIVRECGEEVLARADVGVSWGTVKSQLEADPAFREGLAEAYRQHGAVYAKEMKRRGVDGYQEPVFGSQGPGAGSGIVGWVTRYSDRLLLEQARKFDKAYIAKTVVEQTTTVKGSPSLGLDKLSAESREDLRRILEREQCTNEPEPESDSTEED